VPEWRASRRAARSGRSPRLRERETLAEAAGDEGGASPEEAPPVGRTDSGG